MSLWKMKNKLDERQEQQMKTIEHYGFWVIYFGLAVVILIEGILQWDIRGMLLNVVLLLAVSAYILIATIRHGIWSRYFKPGWKNSIGASVVCGVILFVFTMLEMAHNGMLQSFPEQTILLSLGSAAFGFVLCFLLMWICTRRYRKVMVQKERELDNEE